MTTNALRFPRARIAVFAKAPVPGRVKTRLAQRLGSNAAAAAYRAMLRERMVTLAEAALAPLELWATPHPHPFLRSLARRCGARLRVQPKGDLGGRMAAVLAGGDPCAIIGGDCAGLPASTVGDALAALDAGERVVISPARDGGYTMVAMRHPPRAMFQRMPWGRAVVMAETRRRLARSGIRPRELASSWDVDDYADWRRWRRQRLAFGSCTRGPYC